MCLFLKAANFFEESAKAFVLLSNTFPVSGLSIVPIICSNVDFPAPEGPMIATSSLVLISSEIPLRTLSPL